MTADRDSRFSPGDPPDDEFEEEEEPRSIFSAAWFRVVLVLLGIGVVGAVAVPYVLDVVNPPMDVRTAVVPPPPTPSRGATPSKPPVPAPSSATAPAGESAHGTTSAAPAPAVEPPHSAAPPPPAPATKAPAPTPAPPAAEKPAPKPAEKAAPTPKPVEKAEKPAEKPADKMVAAKKAPAEKPAAAPRVATSAKATTGGDYFVQVGAFREQATAKRVAAQLRDQKYPVDESVTRLGGDAPAAAPRPTPAPRGSASASASSPDRYDVIVSGGSAAEINTRLAAKGLASEPVGDSVRIRPSLPLRDAVALSKDLGSEGFKVQVRRGGGTSAPPAPPVAAAPAPGGDAGGQTLYRVRVGGYPDRAAAQTVLKELRDKGFQPFIAKGRD
jgi:cell division septation protein DedD